MILYGVPGIGKTCFAGQCPGVAFLVDSAENRIANLKAVGDIPADTPVFPPVRSWQDVMGAVESIRTEKHDMKALAIDALGGFEALMHDHVCQRDFNGDWSERGFASYKAGYEVSLPEWAKFLNALDRLRDERDMRLILLGHAKVSPFKNPSGPDYDRYSLDIHQKTWGLTHKWADMVLFANYEVAFAGSDKTKTKAKAKGGKTRIIYTERDASCDAKNQHHLPAEFPMGESGQEGWENFVNAIKAGKEGK